MHFSLKSFKCSFKMYISLVFLVLFGSTPVMSEISVRVRAAVAVCACVCSASGVFRVLYSV